MKANLTVKRNLRKNEVNNKGMPGFSGMKAIAHSDSEMKIDQLIFKMRFLKIIILNFRIKLDFLID